MPSSFLLQCGFGGDENQCDVSSKDKPGERMTQPPEAGNPEWADPQAFLYIHPEQWLWNENVVMSFL